MYDEEQAVCRCAVYAGKTEICLPLFGRICHQGSGDTKLLEKVPVYVSPTSPALRKELCRAKKNTREPQILSCRLHNELC